MKKTILFAASALLLAACGSERSRTMADYADYLSLQEDLTEKVVKGSLSEEEYDKELDSPENFKTVRAGEDAKHNLIEVKDLLSNSDKEALAELLLRDKRNQQQLVDAFIEKKKVDASVKSSKSSRKK